MGVALLRRAGALLVEVQGQHEQMGLADPASHGALLDAFGVPSALRAGRVLATWRDLRVRPWRRWRRRASSIEAAERDEEWLRHAVDELARLAPTDGEEERLAAERQRLQQGERRAEAIAAALAELAPTSGGRDRRGAGPAAALRGAARTLQRLIVPGQTRADNPAAAATAALERAEEALAEAETLLTRLAAEAEADPRLLEKAEERLFALRAAARKHGVAVRRTARAARRAGGSAGGAGHRGGGGFGAGAGGGCRARGRISTPPRR